MGDMDINSLLRLKEALEGAQKNTNRMMGRLEKFENRLSNLEEQMRPIQVTTARYSRAKDNISTTLQEVGKTYEYFRVANDVRETITRGYTSSNQKEFLEAFKKLSQAKLFFLEHREIKSASSVLSNIESLLQTATTGCTQEFDRILQQAGKSVERGPNGQYEIAQPFPADVLKDFKMLCDVFESSHYSGYYKQYQTSRVARVRAHLKDLEAAQGAMWNSVQSDDPYQRDNLPFAELMSLALGLLRSEYQLWSGTLPMNEESMAIFVSICDAVVAEMQRSFMPLLSDAAAKTRAGATLVIRQTKMLLVRLDLFEVFNQRFEDLRDVCHPDARHESSASLALRSMRQEIVEAGMRCIDFLTSTAVGEGFVAPKKGNGGGVLGGSSSNNTNSNSSNKKGDDGIDPLTCDLHPVTGNLLYLCKELTTPDYRNLYRRVVDLGGSFFQQNQLQQQQSNQSANIPQNSLSEADVHMYHNVLASYHEAEDCVVAALENLFVALETRAERFDDHTKPRAMRRTLATNHHSLYDYEDKHAEDYVLTARKHLFLINNLYSLLSFAKERRKDLGGAASSGSSSSGEKAKTQQRPSTHMQAQSRPQQVSSFLERVESRLSSEEELFCETIAMSLGLGAQDMADFQSTYDRDRSNQHRLLKAKFSLFNTGMEAFLAQQGEWRISAASLRDQLAQQLTNRVLQSYSVFFATYGVIKFSKKHMNEYLKYTPAQLEQHLRNFFGRTG